MTSLQCKESHHFKSKLAKKLHDENVWHMNITKPSVIQFCVQLTSFFILIPVKFCCFTSCWFLLGGILIRRLGYCFTTIQWLFNSLILWWHSSFWLFWRVAWQMYMLEATKSVGLAMCTQQNYYKVEMGLWCAIQAINSRAWIIKTRWHGNAFRITVKSLI